MANINLYESHTLVYFVAFSEIFAFQNSWSWKCRSRSWCATVARGRHSIANTRLPISIGTSISHNFRDIRKLNQFQEFDLEMMVNVKEEKNGTCAIRLEMYDSIYLIFFQNFSYLGTFLRQLGHINTKHTNGRGWWLKAKSAMLCLKFVILHERKLYKSNKNIQIYGREIVENTLIIRSD